MPTKILSFLLSVLLLFYAIPSVIFAEVADAAESGESDESDSVDASFLKGNTQRLSRGLACEPSFF